MNIQYQIELHTWWHCGSGQSAGADVDALVIKDKNGMPFIPGKTIKGLLRDAAEELIGWSAENKGKADVEEESPFVKLFGHFDNDKDAMCIADAFFTDATLVEEEYDTIVAKKWQCYLFNSIASTAIDENGIAKNASLRKIQVCVPCKLVGQVLNVPKEQEQTLRDAMAYVKCLGSSRNRGLGRCTFSVLSSEEFKPSATELKGTLQFKATLLSDVVLQQSSATLGANSTLDYIPGACFMGIVASKAYKEYGECPLTYKLFHSGKVHFGDANPAHGSHRASRIPLAMYRPKFSLETENCFIHHTIKDFEKLADEQLKQCRRGYYDFVDTRHAEGIPVEKEIALKSARDKNFRSSAEGQMFCYESLNQGQEFLFEVETDDLEIKEMVSKALVGIHRVGRSRSAQFGLVKIEETSFENPKCLANQLDEDVVVYADSRLIFFDEFGLPTCQPNASDLGIKSPDAKIDWTRSQVRQFSYCPWNFKRQCFDAELCGIEKGSVLVITGAKASYEGKAIVGEHQTEGFGQIYYNPEFLVSMPGSNGRAEAKLMKATNSPKKEAANVSTSLLVWLKGKSDEDILEYDVYSEINKWVANNKGIFSAELFNSQWGQIRALAMEGGTHEEIVNRIGDYLNHGVAKKRWDKFERRKKLMDFIRDSFTDDNIQMAVINLSSEMAKTK